MAYPLQPLSVEREGPDTACLTVRDQGIGISARDQSHVSKMFYRGKGSTERTRGGLGVGLYLVQRIVELHGGSVEVHSDGDNRGAAFSVHLPAEHPPAKPEPPPAARPQTRRQSRRVLIVDDNRDSADALAKLLRAAGDEVRTAYEWAALELAAELVPEVVLLDLGMPTIDGHEVCRRIRGQPWGGGALIVALTGWGRAEDRRRMREAGFDEHLVKPVSVADVDTLLRAGPAGN